jgi:hypothetical protein
MWRKLSGILVVGLVLLYGMGLLTHVSGQAMPNEDVEESSPPSLEVWEEAIIIKVPSGHGEKRIKNVVLVGE